MSSNIDDDYDGIERSENDDVKSQHEEFSRRNFVDFSLE